MTRWPALMLCVLAAAVLTAGRTAVLAHKTVVSKYTFNRMSVRSSNAAASNAMRPVGAAAADLRRGETSPGRCARR